MKRLLRSASVPDDAQRPNRWEWPVCAESYDRFEDLRSSEIAQLAYLASRQRPYGHFPKATEEALRRLLHPWIDVMATVDPPLQPRTGALTVILLEMHGRQRPFWAWRRSEWLEILCQSTNKFAIRYPHQNSLSRQLLFAGAYLLRLFDDFRSLGAIDRPSLASRIFGRQHVERAVTEVVAQVRSWGYAVSKAKEAQWMLCTLLLANGSPNLRDLSVELLQREKSIMTSSQKRPSILVLSKVLAGLGYISADLSSSWRIGNSWNAGAAKKGVASEWVEWVDRWQATTTLQEHSRGRCYLILLKAGRWVTSCHPDCTDPKNWTREIAAEWVAIVCRMQIGDWTQSANDAVRKDARPLSAKARAHHLSAVSSFFRDCQEWEWMSRRFDPRRSFAAPGSIRALIGPKPRVIADDVWAKLLWAGINLTEDDFGSAPHVSEYYYPLAMIKALAIVWLFAGLRIDEIRRLRVGCLVRQPDSTAATDARICLLDVPVNKTSTAFRKPVDALVGEAVTNWERVRPVQPRAIDHKTGEIVNFLFAYRGSQISGGYVNNALIPLLCAKVGVPKEDARGRITSHRARSTIASQLYNAKEPMTLMELQRWLGHKWVSSTQHYLDINSTRLANSYRNTEYFARNIRMIEVLIDRDAVIDGKAGLEPWKFYDLGHGYCSYDFFDQCPHRMACAKCSFYVPKNSTRSLMLEGKSNLLRMRQEIPLKDTELAAIDDGVVAFEKLLAQLADVPTPAGPTPRQIQAPELVQISPKGCSYS